jgi:hypothetical protein
MTGKFIMFGAVGSATAVSRPSLIPSHDAGRGACHSAFRDLTSPRKLHSDQSLLKPLPGFGLRPSDRVLCCGVPVDP